MAAHQRLPSHGDAGLQPERTDLAWGRRTLSMLVAAAVFLHWLRHHDWFVAALVLAAASIAVAIRRRYGAVGRVNGTNSTMANARIPFPNGFASAISIHEVSHA